MEHIFSVIFSLFSYFLGIYIGKNYFSDKKRLEQLLKEIETVANMRISEYNERFIKINTYIDELKQRCGQIPKLQSYSSNAFNRIAELDKKILEINRSIDSDLYQIDNIKKSIAGIQHDTDNNSDDIIFIHEYLNVQKEGEFDKKLLGMGCSADNAVCYKLVKNK